MISLFGVGPWDLVVFILTNSILFLFLHTKSDWEAKVTAG